MDNDADIKAIRDSLQAIAAPFRLVGKLAQALLMVAGALWILGTIFRWWNGMPILPLVP